MAVTAVLDLLPATARLFDLRTDEDLNHASIVATVEARAAEFAAAGLAHTGRLAIAHARPVGFLVDLLAAWRLGAVAVCLPPSLTTGECRIVADTIRPALWIGANAPENVSCLAPREAATATPGGAPLRPTPLVLDEPALILMTSGTTGRPKGVVHTHRSLRTRLALNIAHIGATDLARSLTLLPLHFGHGLIGNSLTPLLAGGALFALPEPGVDGLARLGGLIDRHRITFMSSVPAMWRVALRLSEKPRAGSLARIHVGSAPLAADLWRDIIAWAGIRRVVNTYGITEAANWIGGADASACEPADGLVGRAWGGEIRLRREDGEIAAGGRGEVIVATPALMAAYLDQPDLTAATLQGGWLHTGDTGEIGADGMLRLVGRRKHEINRAGIKIPAEEIDLLLERHPAVQEACAFALADPVAGELVAAAIVARDAPPPDPLTIIRWCEQHIRREAVPARLFWVDTLPRTDRGKINRDTVRDAALARAENP